MKIGILKSITGLSAFAEKAMIDGELLAMEQVNASGGVGGRMLTPVLADWQSNPEVFVEQATNLLEKESVAAIVGTWSRSDRKAVSVVEEHGGLLFYPPAYERLEGSGAAPNQQTITAVRWFLENRGDWFFLAASDTVRGRAENAARTNARRGARPNAAT